MGQQQQQEGAALQYAGEEMKNNKSIVMAAVQQRALALQYNSKEMKDNEATVITALKTRGGGLTDYGRTIVFGFASQRLQQNERVRRAAGL